MTDFEDSIPISKIVEKVARHIMNQPNISFSAWHQQAISRISSRFQILDNYFSYWYNQMPDLNAVFVINFQNTYIGRSRFGENYFVLTDMIVQYKSASLEHQLFDELIKKIENEPDWFNLYMFTRNQNENDSYDDNITPVLDIPKEDVTMYLNVEEDLYTNAEDEDEDDDRKKSLSYQNNELASLCVYKNKKYIPVKLSNYNGNIIYLCRKNSQKVYKPLLKSEMPHNKQNKFYLCTKNLKKYKSSDKCLPLSKLLLCYKNDEGKMKKSKLNDMFLSSVKK